MKHSMQGHYTCWYCLAMVSRVMCLLAFVVAGSKVFAEDGDLDALKPCIQMFKEENIKSGCCSSAETMVVKAGECRKDTGEWTCEDSKCVIGEDIQRDGDEEKLCEKKMKALMDKKKKEYPALIETFETIEKQCLGGQYESYGTDDICPFTKVLVCTYLQTLMTCPEWKDTDTCKKMSENAEKCTAILEKLGK